MTKDKKKKPEALTPEKARALLMQEAQAKVNRCWAKIGEILDEENCLLECSVIVTERGNLPQITVRLKPEGGQQ